MQVPFLALLLSFATSSAMAMCNYMVYPPICDSNGDTLQVGTVHPSLFIPAPTSFAPRGLEANHPMVQENIVPPAPRCKENGQGDSVDVTCPWERHSWMPTHKFAVGQIVRFSPDLGQRETANRGDSFIIVRLLPEAAGVVQYRVKRESNGHERVVQEGQLGSL